MTLRTSRLLTLSPAAIIPAAILSAAIVFTAILAPRPLHAQLPPAPCALLSPLQIKTVLNTPLSEGKPGTPSDGTTDCTWSDSKGETRVYLSLKDPGYGYKSFRDSMLATGRLVPIPGLANDAFFISSAGNSAALYALKGKHLLLITVDGVGFTKVQNESAEQTLATAILPKL
jgi:hypothetical protein